MLNGEDLLRRDPTTAARFRPLLELGERLLRFALVMPPAGSVKYAGASPELVISSVFALFTMATKTLRGIHHLSGNVLTEPAVMLVRPMDEAWASLGYIISDPSKRAERAEWYLVGEATEKYKWAQRLQGAGLDALLPPERLQDPNAILVTVRRRLIKREEIERGASGADERAEKKLKQMLETGRWADVPNEKMHEIAERWTSEGRDEDVVTYVTVFKMASGVLHARQPDMFMKLADDGTIYPNLQADPTFLPFALFVSNLLYISMLQMVNEVLALPWQKSIKGFLDEMRPAGEAAKGS